MDEQKLLIDLVIQGDEEIQKSIEATAELRKEVQRLKDENKEMTKSETDQSQAIEKNNTQIRQLNKSIRENTKQVDTKIQQAATEAGSLVQLRANYRRLATEYDNLSRADREGARGMQLQEQLAATNEELAEAEKSTGRHQRMVGSYAEAIQAGAQTIFGMREALTQLEQQQGETSQETFMLEKRMGELRDQIEKTEARIKAHSMDALPALVAGLQMVAGASQLVVSSFAIVGEITGKNSEQLEKLQRVTVQIIGVMQTLSVLQQQIASGQAKAIVLKTVDIVKTAALAVAYKVAALGQLLWAKAVRVFSVAVYNIPVLGWLLAIIGAIIAAVVLVVKHWDRFTAALQKMGRWMGISRKQTEDVNAQLKSQAEQIKNIVDAEKQMRKQRQNRIRDINHELQLMKAQGKSVDELKVKERELLLIKLEQAKADLVVAEAMAARYKVAQPVLEAVKRSVENITRELEVFDAAEQTRGAEQVKKSAEQKQALIDKEQEHLEKVAALQMTERQRAEHEAKLKYEALIKEAEQFGKDSSVLVELYEKERLEIAETFNKEEIKLEEDKQKEITERRQKQLEQYRKGRVLEIIGAVDEKNQRLQIEREFLVEQLKLHEGNAEQQMELKIQLAQLDVQIYDAEMQRLKEGQDQYIKAFSERSRAVMEFAQLTFEFQANMDARRMQDFTKQQTEKQGKLKDRLDAGKISQADYDRALERMNQEREAKEAQAARKAAIRQKLIASAMVAVDLARSIMSILSTGGGTAYMDMGVTAGALIAINSGIAAAQLAAINSAPLPEAAAGMLIGGNRHAQGGQAIIAEQGEAVMTRGAVSRFLPELSAMNVMGGGQSFTDQPSGFPTAQEIAQAMQNVHIAVAVDEINRVNTRVNVIENYGQG